MIDVEKCISSFKPQLSHVSDACNLVFVLGLNLNASKEPDGPDEIQNRSSHFPALAFMLIPKTFCKHNNGSCSLPHEL